ncbi:MAG TPA: serine--tRNA ligase [Aestuariivirgaceae bacterium]|nr:serine--tRNA ligase [Aestuariivirgaceae bacterium]
MHDIRSIRDNPEAFDQGLARRGLKPQSGEILAIDARRREEVQKLQDSQARRNAASKEIGEALGKKDAPRADRLKGEVQALKAAIQSGEEEERQLSARLGEMLSVIPNLPLPEVPDGKDETANREVVREGTPPRFDFKPKQHFEIGEGLGLMDFDTAAALAGARFVVLKGPLARLERALAQFMLDLHTSRHGYSENYVPLLVRDQAVFGTGSLPKFAEDLFATTDGRWLIPTAEVSLTNFVRDKITPEAELPMRLTAYTPCFRSEAGAAGKDTRGMIRQHQFSKVELVSITVPEQSRDELERMRASAEAVLKALGLAYRIVVLSTGDMGFAARMTYDIEVWLAGQNAYREISSCSDCGDFQARRMEARYRPGDGKSPRYVHTLNGSALAVGRTLIAILENYQQPDGSVVVPEVLVPYMGGLDRISRSDG